MGLESSNRDYSTNFITRSENPTLSALDKKLLAIALKIEEIIHSFFFFIHNHTLILDDVTLNKKIVNYAFKGMNRDQFVKAYDKLIEFEGQLSGVSLKGNLHYAKKFYEKNNEKLSPEEQIELKELIKHREHLLQNLAIIHNTFLTDELMVKFFQNKIDNLKDPSTSVCLKDGSTSFSIPLETKGHYTTLEFQREPSGKHYLRIHDRSGIDFGFPTLLKDGKEYGKISPRIPLSEGQLKDPRIIYLIKLSPNIEFIQFCGMLREILNITDGIEKKPIEEKFYQYLKDRFGSQSTYNYSDLDQKGRELFEELMQENSFGSFQTMGTCTESNQTGPEVNIISSPLKKAVKAFVIESLIEKVEKTWSWFNSKKENEVIAKGLKERVAQLKGKEKPQS